MPSTATRFSFPLAMRRPPLHHERGHHGDQKIDDDEAPEPAPVAKHLPQACAQLIDANEAVDGEIRGENIANPLDPFRDLLARPSETRQEKLRQAGAEEDQRRSLWMLEPDASRLAHEAGSEDEERGK